MTKLISTFFLAAGAVAVTGIAASAQAPDSCSGWYTQCTQGGSATQWIPGCEQARQQCLRSGTFVAPRNGEIYGTNLKKR